MASVLGLSKDFEIGALKFQRFMTTIRYFQSRAVHYPSPLLRYLRTYQIVAV